MKRLKRRLKRGLLTNVIFIFLSFCLPDFIFSQEPGFKQTSPDTYFQSAVRSYFKGDYPESLRLLRECFNLEPVHPKAAKLLPLVLKRQDEELRGCEEKTNSLLGEEHFRLGLSLYVMGKSDLAVEELQKTLKISPDHTKAKQLLDKILAKGEEKKELPPCLLPPQKAKERISLNFKETPINEVLSTLSGLYQINLVASEEVSGNVTVNFIDVGLEEALKTILSIKGLSYKVEGDIIYIFKQDEQALVTKTFKLKNTSFSTEQIDKIKEALTGEEKFFYDSKTRTVMVTMMFKNINSIEELIKKLDSQRKQVLIETRFLDVSLDKLHQLGVDWTLDLSLTTTSTTRPITFPFVPGGSPVLEQFFPMPKPSEVGTEFLSSDRRELTFSEAADFTLGSVKGPKLTAVLHALETNTDTAVLSSPRIVAMDDEEAKIVVGWAYPIPTFERNEDTGEFELTGYEEKDIGMVLTVTPQIFEDGKIILALHPEVSAIDKPLSAEIPYPIITTREAQTKVNIKDGDTLVIGGLISEREVEALKKIPALSSIPFFGALFRYRSKTKVRSELLVFITVNILPF